MDGVTPWHAFVLGIFTLIGVGMTFLAKYLGNGVQMMARINELTTQVFDLQKKNADCDQRTLELRYRIRTLEMNAGVVPSVDIHAGIIVADLQGIIKEYSPSLTPLLKWMPQELKGKNILVLIPADIQEQHRTAFDRVCANPESIDPMREVQTYALDKAGNKVAVAITHHGWKSAKGDGFITATIKQRGSMTNDSGQFKIPKSPIPGFTL